MPAVTADQLPPDMTIVNEVLSWNRTSPQTLQSHVIVTPSLHLISTRSSRFAAASSCSHTAALSDARQGVYHRTKDEDETPLLCDRSPLACKRNENRGLARASHSHAVSSGCIRGAPPLISHEVIPYVDGWTDAVLCFEEPVTTTQWAVESASSKLLEEMLTPVMDFEFVLQLSRRTD